MSKTKVKTGIPSMTTAFHKMLITVIIFASLCIKIYVILETKTQTK